MDLDNREDRIVACSHYVIGLLSDEEKSVFEQKLATDDALATEVAKWQDYLVLTTDAIPAVEPSSTLWQRIDASTPDRPMPAMTQSEQHAVGSVRRPMLQSLALWRFLTGVGFALSLVLGYQSVYQAPETRVFVAVLKSPAAQRTGWMIQARSTGDVQLVPLEQAVPVPPDKSLQLWTKLPGADKPVSLGLVESGQMFSVSTDSLPGLAEEQLFEITLEELGGSPTGLPTGPIQFIGNAERL